MVLPLEARHVRGRKGREGRSRDRRETEETVCVCVECNGGIERVGVRVLYMVFLTGGG